MPTKAPPRRKKKPGARRVSSKQRKETRKSAGPSAVRRAGSRVTRHLSPRAADVVGVGLLVLAILLVLGQWLGAGGPFGRLLQVVTRGLFGPVGYALPVVALYWGVLLLRGTARDDRGRMLVGLTITALGVLGLASLVGRNPSPAAGYAAVGDAGGVAGAAVAWPLSVVASPYGAIVVCLGLVLLGVLVFTATPLSALWRGLRRLFVREEPALGADDAPPARRERRQRPAPREAADEQGPALTQRLQVADLDLPGGGEPKQIRLPLPDTGDGYKLPPLELLRPAPAPAADAGDAKQTMSALERTFQNFGVPARVMAAHRGPTVTMYEVEVDAGTKVNKVRSLAEEIAYALATPHIRIIAPIPGRSAIGVEVPNKVRDYVTLGEVLSSKPLQEARHPLVAGLGKDVHGRAVPVNLAEMPHLLIAGATGAGKSSLINAFVTSLLMRATPDDVKLVLIDPKRVELSHFADLPHLLSPVIVHPKRAAEALGWVVREMEMRYETLATVAMRDIDTYRRAHAEGTLRVPPGREEEFGRMPYIVVVIDELSDLMMVAPRDVEDAIVRISQMARAVGIHLVVATQRPSVDVVTGLIKANIPSRIAFMTASQADSRVILDVGGAEKLVGHGDMLFQPATASKAHRIQGAWVSEKEMEAVTAWCRKQRGVEFQANIDGLGRPPTEDEDDLSAEDDLLEQAADLVIRSQEGSTSMLQRKLKVGFARAGRLMDLLEDRGIVGPSVGSKKRDVLMTWEEWQESRQRVRS